MGKRGWDENAVTDAMSNPSRTVSWKDTRFNKDGTRMNDFATAYCHRDGGYIVVNDRTKDLVQASDKNDLNWIAPWD